MGTTETTRRKGNTTPAPGATGTPPTKLSAVLLAMELGEWQQAFRICARFPDLGKQRAAILDAHMAYTNPRFLRQLGKDPEAVIEAGKLALRDRYCKEQA